MHKKIELLSPAGTLKSMEYAFAYGADAVYAGAPRYSLRVRNNDFIGENLAKGIARAHELGKQFFLTANVIPHNKKIKTFMRDIRPTLDLKPDALIMADPGLIMMVKEVYPDMPIHLSVQANTINYAAAKFWQQAGVSRVILSRELSIDEVKEIKDHCPDLEIEVFVHGALCIAYSGRCLLSGYFNRRDPNQGTCTNACRWQYKTHEGTTSPEGVSVMLDNEKGASDLAHHVEKPLIFNPESDIASQGQRSIESEGVYFLEEANRPGEFMEISEDEHGTYIMNSKDLRAIEHVQSLIDAGVDCLKIEGRTKSHYYVARTAQLYKQAVNDALANRAFDQNLIGKLENLANRGYTDGFYQRHHTQDYQNYIENVANKSNQRFVGEVGKSDEQGFCEVIIKNKITVGDRVELIQPSGNRDLVIQQIQTLKGQDVEVAPGSGHIMKIPLGEVTDDWVLLAKYEH